ncbi:MAG: hypothetical protein ACE5FN_00560 [Leptospirillia bacterium]
MAQWTSGRWIVAALWVFLTFLVLPASGMAAEDETRVEDEPLTFGRWSVGLSAGSYAPDIRQLNNALGTAGLVLLQDPNFLIPRNENLPVEIRDVAVPELTSNGSYGLEVQWHWHPRTSFVVSLANWQGRTGASDQITMALRSNLPPIQVPRTARYNLNINQIWLGWRYQFFKRPEIGQLYVNIGLAGFAVVDLSMDALLKVSEASDEIDLSFASISSTEVHGTAYSTKYGAGGEFFLSKHTSVGFHVNYVFGELDSFRVSRYFPSGFSELPPVPPQATGGLPDNTLPPNFAQPNPGEQLQEGDITYPTEGVERLDNPRPVLMDLDGWEMGLMFRVYY